PHRRLRAICKSPYNVSICSRIWLKYYILRKIIQFRWAYSKFCVVQRLRRNFPKTKKIITYEAHLDIHELLLG
ncbi:PIPO, partial [Barley mild mosaic virus]|uniref:PIPO n=1 Tax=Barley mild mosaic virus TaxID=12466 RepID=UPI000264F5C7